jgi:hypothetical protein
MLAARTPMTQFQRIHKKDKAFAPDTPIHSALHRIDDHITCDGLEDTYMKLQNFMAKKWSQVKFHDFRII